MWRTRPRRSIELRVVEQAIQATFSSVGVVDEASPSPLALADRSLLA
jgi:hypothetical protein